MATREVLATFLLAFFGILANAFKLENFFCNSAICLLCFLLIFLLTSFILIPNQGHGMGDGERPLLTRLIFCNALRPLKSPRYICLTPQHQAYIRSFDTKLEVFVTNRVVIGRNYLPLGSMPTEKLRRRTCLGYLFCPPLSDKAKRASVCKAGHPV